MTPETLTTYSRAFADVFAESGFEQVSASDMQPRDASINRQIDVSVSVGLTGGLKGFVFLQARTADAIAIANAIGAKMGVEMPAGHTLDEMHRAALSEIANQVSGRATIYLSERGIDTDITPPTVVSGQNVQFAVPEGLDVYHSTLDATVAEMSLVLGVVAS